MTEVPRGKNKESGKGWYFKRQCQRDALLGSHRQEVQRMPGRMEVPLALRWMQRSRRLSMQDLALSEGAHLTQGSL